MTRFPEKYEELFYKALRIRIIEERVAEIYPSDRIQSPVHLSIGQEHISVGVCAELRASDLAFGTYRSHALYLAKGGDLAGFFGELFGKRSGCGKGKAGSMHLSDFSVGCYGSSAIVASTIPHSVGAALAAKTLGKDQVVACFYGEGATGQGVYHESLNISAKHRLPVLFVCENNGLGIYTPTEAVHSFRIAEHAKAYGIQSHLLKEGWDLAKISDLAREGVTEIRQGKGPIVLEIMTHRNRQHVGPDEDYHLGYRSRSELEAWAVRDPLTSDRERIEKYRPIIEEEIDRAIRAAEASPFPTLSDLDEDVR
jgi:TPP-dependent pyruvate/acetoin dehydrogenase alpha subunit